MIAKLTPPQLKLQIKILRNTCYDLLTGRTFSYAKASKKDLPLLSHHIQITQNLKPNNAKLINLNNAISQINKVIIPPSKTFSFWKIVGHPTTANGYVTSRSIVNGKVTGSVGGGLCQLSGLIYYISLMGGLKIIERHNHSMDIYTDEERFAPLGSDATVAFGNKDLKIKNTHNSTIQFYFIIDKNEITIQLKSNIPIKQKKVSFNRVNINSNQKTIETFIDNAAYITSTYKIM